MTVRHPCTQRWTHLWASTADLTHITIVYLRRFGGLFGPQLFALKGGLLSEGVACPCCSCSYSCHCLLLLLLLLVVTGGCRVNCSFIARVWGSWNTSKPTYCCSVCQLLKRFSEKTFLYTMRPYSAFLFNTESDERSQSYANRAKALWLSYEVNTAWLASKNVRRIVYHCYCRSHTAKNKHIYSFVIQNTTDRLHYDSPSCYSRTTVKSCSCNSVFVIKSHSLPEYVTALVLYVGLWE